MTRQMSARNTAIRTAMTPEETREDERRGVPSAPRVSHFATLLSAKIPPVMRDGKKFYEIPIAVAGSWVKQGQRFSITEHDLQKMVRNFGKRRNEQVVIDYEHASEMPEVARGGPVPAAGWIHDLLVNGGKSEVRSELNSEFQTPSPQLYALIEWTAEAEKMIQSGQYRFFSPAIDWGCCDKLTGEPQGATLTSGALTNHPFLEELPPIILTDLEAADGILPVSDQNPQRNQAGASEPCPRVALAANPARARAAATPSGEGGTNLNKLTVKKLTDGPQAGHYGVFNGEESAGYLDQTDFLDCVKQYLAAGELDDDIRQRISLTDPQTESGQGRSLLLREAVKDGGLDSDKAAVLARDGRISLDDYIAAVHAERRLDDAVRTGKILPRDRGFFFRDALDRPNEFSEYIRHTVPAVRLGSIGLGSAGELSVDDDVRVRTQQLMRDDNLSYSKALRKVFAGDRELEQRYHAAHRREVGLAENVAAELPTGLGITH